MKSLSEIRVKIIEINSEIDEAEKEHKSLGQIDRLSSTGSNLRKKINNLKGWKEALTWVWK